MVAFIDELFIGGSATALVTYLLAKVRCIIKNPCTNEQVCIYGSNESSITVEDELIIISSPKKSKPIC